MRSFSIILGLVVSLFISPAKAAESVSYRIGVIVTYVDLCSHWKGFTVDYSQIRKIREAGHRDIKIFVITGGVISGFTSEQQMFLETGVDGVILKPVTKVEIYQKLHKVFGRKAS